LRPVAAFALLAGLVLANAAFAGPYTRLQVLMPGETAAPGTPSGKSGSARAQTVGVPFTITVRACDSGWNTVTTVTDAIQTLCSDASATLPAVKQLASGVTTMSVTFNAAGTFTVYAHDQTDGTIPDGASAATPAYVLQGFTFSNISQKNQSAGVPLNITIRAVDPAGNLVSGFNGDVTLQEVTSYGPGRTSPATVTFTNGQWSGGVTMYRADETSINRGNVNLTAFLASAPSKNGTSDPFTVHPGGLARIQAVVPGQTPLPGSISGVTGSPSAQAAGTAFPVDAWATDAYWNPVGSGDNVRLTSSDAQMAPVSGVLSNGWRQFTVTLRTVGNQTLTSADLTNGSVQGMTTAAINVISSAVHHFAIDPIASPVTAGTPVVVTVRAVDVGGNLVPGYAAEARLSANTGAGSISPEDISFVGGVWTGPLTFYGAGGSVAITCSDYAAPPHTGSRTGITVVPGPMAGLQVILPGETAQGGSIDGKNGTPLAQQAGAQFMITVRAVDAWWNLVSGVNDHVALTSSDAFATLPPDTTLANGQLLVPARLYRTGSQRIYARDLTLTAMRPDTSSAVTVTGGPFSRLVILAPGEYSAPGTANGRAGTPTDESINYAFQVTVLATDAWFNPVGGVTDVVHLTSDDPLAILDPDEPLVDGSTTMSVRLARGGYDLISVADVTSPSKQGNSTQVRAISSGFHLEASIAQDSAKAGEPFTLTVKVTNDAGSVIQEINSFVSLQVLNSSSRGPGRGQMLTTEFQLLQGQRSVSETYTYAETIVVVARDDAGNAPAISNAIAIGPGVPTHLALTSSPSWVGGNKHATLTARVSDDYDNGVPNQPVTFSQISGTGTLTPIDLSSDGGGRATADFLSPREPEHDQLRAVSNALTANLDLEVAFVDPGAAAGSATNYPNPFHPPFEPTTLAYKLADDARVEIRVFTQSGDLVLRRTFDHGAVGGKAGLNAFVWDGRNGNGTLVASGGYICLIEAHGTSETMHVIRRKIALVR
jgi:hypothetical protein